jgi:Holliday junction resolvase-like predicted endonuclease
MAEMGESVVGAYLRLIKGCEIVTYNQRLSREKGEFGEADVIAIDVDSTTVYICEVVTHLGGILYAGGNPGTLRKLQEKFRRIDGFAARLFPTYQKVFMLWSPYVPIGFLTEGLRELQQELARQNQSLELKINVDYTACINELRDLARGDMKDHGEPFFRALQILEHLR